MSRCQISYRTTPEKRDELKRLAALAGVSIGDYLEAIIEATGAENDDAERNRRAIRSTLKWIVRTSPIEGPFWHKVAHVLGLGSMEAEQICSEYGFDMVSGLERGAS